MKTNKTITLMLAVLATCAGFTTTAQGDNLLTNGDFSSGETGWTRWEQNYGSSLTYDTSQGKGKLLCSGNMAEYGTSGSLGWYQRVSSPSAGGVSLSGDWAGGISLFDEGGAWAHVMLFAVDPTTTDQQIVDRITSADAGDIAFAKDTWGMNPPTEWDNESLSLSPSVSGNQGVIPTSGSDDVVVALRLGTGLTLDWAWVAFDNLVLSLNAAPDTGALHIFKFFDANRDGSFNEADGDYGLPWAFIITGGQLGGLLIVETDENGHSVTNGLAPGEYSVAEILPLDWVCTTEGGTMQTKYLTIDDGGTVLFEFGNAPEPATMGLLAAGAISLLRRRKRAG